MANFRSFGAVSAFLGPFEFENEQKIGLFYIILELTNVNLAPKSQPQNCRPIIGRHFSAYFCRPMCLRKIYRPIFVGRHKLYKFLFACEYCMQVGRFLSADFFSAFLKTCFRKGSLIMHFVRLAVRSFGCREKLLI